MTAAHLGSRTKIWRIENGEVPVKVPDVWALCEFYGATPAEREALAALAVETNEEGWWEEYRDVVPAWFRLYVGLEAAAARIATFEDCVVPGELQTASYAEAVFASVIPTGRGPRCSGSCACASRCLLCRPAMGPASDLPGFASTRRATSIGDTRRCQRSARPQGLVKANRVRLPRTRADQRQC